jgi:hypothetical protein
MTQPQEAFARLVAELENVTGDQREEWIETLVAFSRFAKSCDLSPAWKRLYELAQRLDDLNRGVLIPCSRVRRRAGETSGTAVNRGTGAN